VASTHYVGKAGQFAVMAELSFRGYNVAIPEIDIGDDVFVLNDATGQLTRIQVKTSTGTRLVKRVREQAAYRCQFSVRRSHVDDPVVAGSHYIFAGRCGSRWRFLVLERAILRDRIANGNLGSAMPNGTHMITLIFIGTSEAASSTRAAGIDLTPFVANWNAWPELR
jgi:hypothetical protein